MVLPICNPHMHLSCLSFEGQHLFSASLALDSASFRASRLVVIRPSASATALHTARARSHACLLHSGCEGPSIGTQQNPRGTPSAVHFDKPTSQVKAAAVAEASNCQADPSSTVQPAGSLHAAGHSTDARSHNSALLLSISLELMVSALLCTLGRSMISI